MFSTTVKIRSCINNNDKLDSYSAKTDFDNEVTSRCKYGVSYTERLHNIIDELTMDGIESSNSQSTNVKYSNCEGTDQVADKDWTDEYCNLLPNGLTAHISHSNDSDTSKVKCDAIIPYKTVGFLNHTVPKFSFIGPDRAPVDIKSVEQCLHIAEVIANTGCPNYAQARIPLVSNLNIHEWEKELYDYPDRMLIEYLKFGFPLSLANPDNLHNIKVVNHHSAIQYPDAVNDYLHREIALGAIVGPVDDITCKNYHCSPLLSRPKDSDKRRIILNLSHPYGNSVNDNVPRDTFDGHPFSLKFPSIDNIVQHIIALKDQDPVLYKIGVARAFRNIRVDPVDTVKLGIHWQDQYFLDLSVAFGWAHGSATFQHVSDVIVHLMRRKGYGLVAYIDDYVGIAPAKDAQAQFDYLSALLTRLGLPMNPDKRVPPSKVLTCLGIQVDIVNSSLSIDQAKLEAIHNECFQVANKKYLSKKRFQSLLGKLIYLHKCVIPARTFVNRILQLLRDNTGKKRIQLNTEFFKDIAWFQTFLPHFNGTTKFDKPGVEGSNSLTLDACLTGLGAVWKNRVYSTPTLPIPGFALTIVHWEMLNIVIALRMWGKYWKHRSILVYCDNEACVHVVATSKTRDLFLAACIRNIWLLTAYHDISLHIQHIRGRDNVKADLLSRLYSNKPIDQRLFHNLKDKYIWDNVLPHHFDLDLSI